ncbi:hypothetical protein T439DRAFT_234280 [Meredithblackwellia eburnea MCA 4105]
MFCESTFSLPISQPPSFRAPLSLSLTQLVAIILICGRLRSHLGFSSAASPVFIETPHAVFPTSQTTPAWKIDHQPTRTTSNDSQSIRKGHRDPPTVKSFSLPDVLNALALALRVPDEAPEIYIMGQIDTTIGSLLLATWANTIFLTVEVMMSWRYFTRFRDGLLITLPLAFILLLDLLSSAADYSTVYLYTITHWGDSEFLLKQPSTIPIFAATTGASSTVVQLYLVSRFAKLTATISSFIRFPIVFILIALSITSFAGAIWAAIVSGVYPNYVQRSTLRGPVTVWLALSAAADVAIAASLVIQLIVVQMRHKIEISNHVAKFIHKIILRTIETGTATATVAAIALVMYLRQPEDNISTGLAYCLGRLYSISMLVSLLSRDAHVRPDNDKGTATIYPPHWSKAIDPPLPNFRSKKSNQKTSNIPSNIISKSGTGVSGGGIVDQIAVTHVQTVHVEEAPISLDMMPSETRPTTAESRKYNLGLDDIRDVKDPYNSF